MNDFTNGIDLMTGPEGPRPERDIYRRIWRWSVGYAVLDDYCKNQGITRDEIYKLIDTRSVMVGRADSEVYLEIEDGISLIPLASRMVDRDNFSIIRSSNEETLARVERDTDLELIRRYLERPSPLEFIRGSIKRAKNPDKIKDRIKKNVYFQPWGTAYDGKMNKRTKRAVDTTLSFLNRIAEYKIDNNGGIPRLIIMPADYYAGTIDGWDRQIVQNFIQELRDYAYRVENNYRVDVEIIPYSIIVDENKIMYEKIKSGLDSDRISLMMEGKITAAEKWANGNAEEATRNYVVERLTEGILIDNLFEPIKISLGSYDKDDCDGPLPVIYLQRTPIFPWIQSKWEEGT